LPCVPRPRARLRPSDKPYQTSETRAAPCRCRGPPDPVEGRRRARAASRGGSGPIQAYFISAADWSPSARESDCCRQTRFSASREQLPVGAGNPPDASGPGRGRLVVTRNSPPPRGARATFARPGIGKSSQWNKHQLTRARFTCSSSDRAWSRLSRSCHRNRRSPIGRRGVAITARLRRRRPPPSAPGTHRRIARRGRPAYSLVLEPAHVLPRCPVLSLSVSPWLARSKRITSQPLLRKARR